MKDSTMTILCIGAFLPAKKQASFLLKQQFGFCGRLIRWGQKIPSNSTKIWAEKTYSTGFEGCLCFTCRIIPFSKCLLTMVILSPPSRIVPLPNGLFMAEINAGSQSLTSPGMILQVGTTSRFSMGINPIRSNTKQTKTWQSPPLRSPTKVGSTRHLKNLQQQKSASTLISSPG